MIMHDQSCVIVTCDYNVPIFIHFGLIRTPKKMICNLSLRVWTQSLPSLLNTIDCPCRYHMACLILTTRLFVLKRTHYWIRDEEKVGYLAKRRDKPKTNSPNGIQSKKKELTKRKSHSKKGTVPKQTTSHQQSPKNSFTCVTVSNKPPLSGGDHQGCVAERMYTQKTPIFGPFFP